MLNNILMIINLGTGIGPGFYYSPFSVDSVRTHSAIVVGLAEFGSVTAFTQPNKLKETMPSNPKILLKIHILIVLLKKACHIY